MANKVKYTEIHYHIQYPGKESHQCGHIFLFPEQKTGKQDKERYIQTNVNG